MSADKRTVTTDALQTLGTILTEESKAGRDAIHLAVEPCIAGENLYAGQHIGIIKSNAGTVGSTKLKKKLGIVDPFVVGPIPAGSKFWLVLYPRQITSLRHVWEHPDFDSETVENPNNFVFVSPGIKFTEVDITDVSNSSKKKVLTDPTLPVLAAKRKSTKTVKLASEPKVEKVIPIPVDKPVVVSMETRRKPTRFMISYRLNMKLKSGLKGLLIVFH